MDVVVVGSANVDVVLSVERIPAPGSTVLAGGRELGPGGKGANQVVAAARLGARSAFLAAVGADAAAGLVLDELTSADVAVDAVRRVERATGTAYVLVDGEGQNAIVVDAGANEALTDLTADELELLAEASVVLCQLEVPLETVTAALSAARGLRVLNAAPSTALPDALTEHVDVLVVNEHEALEVAGRQDLKEAVGDLLERVPEVVVTLGAAGALVARRGADVVPVPAERPQAVVDTTGAGDTFCGAYAAARALGSDGLQATRSAIRAATLSVERHGAARSAPTRAEVEDRWPEG
jgi:ribokinase